MSIAEMAYRVRPVTINCPSEESKCLMLFDANVDWHKHSGTPLLNPVQRVRIANNLAQTFMLEIECFTLVLKTLPTKIEQAFFDLSWMRMSSRNVLHAADDRGLAFYRQYTVNPDIKTGRKTV